MRGTKCGLDRGSLCALAPGLRPRDRFRSAGLSSPVVTVAAPKANHMTSVCWLALRGRGFKLRSAEIPGGARDFNSVDRNLMKLGAPAGGQANKHSLMVGQARPQNSHEGASSKRTSQTDWQVPAPMSGSIRARWKKGFGRTNPRIEKAGDRGASTGLGLAEFGGLDLDPARSAKSVH